MDLLKREDIQNEKAQEYIRILDEKSQRLKRLTLDLVEASKISSGNITLKMGQLNVSELFTQAIGEYEDKWKEKGLQICNSFSFFRAKIIKNIPYFQKKVRCEDKMFLLY